MDQSTFTVFRREFIRWSSHCLDQYLFTGGQYLHWAEKIVNAGEPIPLEEGRMGECPGNTWGQRFHGSLQLIKGPLRDLKIPNRNQLSAPFTDYSSQKPELKLDRVRSLVTDQQTSSPISRKKFND